MRSPRTWARPPRKSAYPSGSWRDSMHPFGRLGRGTSTEPGKAGGSSIGSRSKGPRSADSRFPTEKGTARSRRGSGNSERRSIASKKSRNLPPHRKTPRNSMSASTPSTEPRPQPTSISWLGAEPTRRFLSSSRPLREPASACPPPGCDPEPLLRLLNNASPQGEAFRSRSFYGLLELPGYSDAKLTHVFGDARLIRSALDYGWAWLKAIRDDERRSLQIQWSEDVTML